MAFHLPGCSQSRAPPLPLRWSSELSRSVTELAVSALRPLRQTGPCSRLVPWVRPQLQRQNPSSLLTLGPWPSLPAQTHPPRCGFLKRVLEPHRLAWPPATSLAQLFSTVLTARLPRLTSPLPAPPVPTSCWELQRHQKPVCLADSCLVFRATLQCHLLLLPASPWKPPSTLPAGLCMSPLRFVHMVLTRPVMSCSHYSILVSLCPQGWGPCLCHLCPRSWVPCLARWICVSECIGFYSMRRGT